MKITRLIFGLLLAMTAVAPLRAQISAFTYQGRLNLNGAPANGYYDFMFRLLNDATNGVAAPVIPIAVAVPVTNGLFTTGMDFGGENFDGIHRWLEINVRTNGGGSFTTLSPRQLLTSTPYAITANTASNLLGMLPAGQLIGTLSNGQLANSFINVNAGSGLGGGGSVALGGSTTLTNTGVRSITGNSDITASTLNGAVTLGSTATSANSANSMVKRDANGNFSASTIIVITNLFLPATRSTAGVIYSGTNTLLHSYGTENFFAGVNAGNLTMGGCCNTAVGWRSLQNNTSGRLNTAVGDTALLYNTNGINNTAIGYGALYYNREGNYNTANGVQALYINTIGNYNTALGGSALFYNSYGSFNTANGYQALYKNTGGLDNTANGYWALYSNTDGINNTAIGVQALTWNTTGGGNTGSGVQALYNNTIGFNNTASGSAALFNNISGSLNVALGYQAGYNLTGGSNNICIGNLGVASDDGIVRIGTQGTQAATFIAGIYGASAASGTAVYVNSAGQLGTLTSSARFKQHPRHGRRERRAAFTEARNVPLQS